MAQKLYNGKSEGFASIVEGNIEYSKEVITNRAVPDLRDGLKPVQRRILNCMNNMKLKNFTVATNAVGSITPYHPHGDSSVYEAMVRITDQSEYYQVPLLAGDGNYGKVYSTDGAAAPRYTKTMLHKNGKEFFNAMNGIEWVEDEMGEGVEPSALPVPYPYMLVAGGSGIAVGVSTKIPSFNFWDVLDITETFIKKKSLDESDIIYPDYPTGGHYIVDRGEALKVMLTGRGRVKVRADIEIEGKNIVVHAVPVGKTVQKIKKVVDDIRVNKDDALSGKIGSVYDAVSYQKTEKVVIACKNVGVVEEVLMELYRRGILQTQVKTNILTIQDKLPVMGGVYGIVERWVAWRKDVLHKHISTELEALRAELPQLEFFIKLVQDKPNRDEFLNRLTNTSTRAGINYLLETMEGIDQESAEWISSRRASAFLDGGKEKTRYDNIRATIEKHELSLSDLDGEILSDLDELRKAHAGQHKRLTELTTTDYQFSKVTAERSSSSSKAVTFDNSPAFFTIYRDGMLRKTTTRIAEKGDPGVLNVVEGRASDALIGFDNYGRILKVYGEDVPFHSGASSLYLPRFFDVPEDTGVPYFILYMGALDGTTKTLLFEDGMMSFLDTTKWVDAKAKYRIVNKGVALEVYDELVDVIEEADMPEVLIVHDRGRENKSRFSSVRVSDIHRPKGSRGRTRVFKGTDIEIIHWGGITEEEWSNWLDVDNPSRYEVRVNSLPGNDYDRFNIDILGSLNEGMWPSQVGEEESLDETEEMD